MVSSLFLEQELLVVLQLKIRVQILSPNQIEIPLKIGILYFLSNHAYPVYSGKESLPR